MPKHSLAELESRYPRTTLSAVTAVVVPGMPAATLATLPPVPTVAAAPVPTGSPALEPLRLAHRGGVVGYPVVDSLGQPVGTIDAVATVPGTGEVRCAIISGPTFGPGFYIAALASSTGAAEGRVVLAGTLATWNQAPRYRSEQVQQSFGPLGDVH